MHICALFNCLNCIKNSTQNNSKKVLTFRNNDVKIQNVVSDTEANNKSSKKFLKKIKIMLDSKKEM